VSYQVTIRKKALKELEELPVKVNQSIRIAIDSLAENPRPKGSKKLKGEQEYIWRIRVGDYRVLYAIEEKIKVVEIRKIGNRNDVYN